MPIDESRPKPAVAVVLGSVNADLVARGARLPGPGQTVLADEFYRAHGGKGANQAVAAARAGARTTFLGVVGDDDFGRASLADLAAEGVVLRVRVAPGVATGIALILVDEAGRNMIAVHPGANALASPEWFASLDADIWKDAGVFLAQLEIPLATVAAGLKRAREAGAIALLNPAPAPADPEALDALLPFADVALPNEVELEQATGVAATSAEAAVAGARKLMDRGAGSVVATLGERGCAVVARDGVAFVPALPVRAVDTVAAGDAFAGALAVRLAERASEPRAGGRPEAPGLAALTDAAKWATRAAALSVARKGARPSLPRREEIDAQAAPASPSRISRGPEAEPADSGA